MKTYNALILTDHLHHSMENSVYPLARALKNHPLTNQADISTRGNPANKNFFNNLQDDKIWATEIEHDFSYSDIGLHFLRDLKEVSLRDYDLIWLRLPPPINKQFLDFLRNTFSGCFIINSPGAIYDTGSKAFLMRFKEICAPMKICRSLEDIIEFKTQFPIVLKPFREYGGKGILRIDGQKVWHGSTQTSFDDFAAELIQNEVEYLAVKYLKNVVQGDKRIIVINGRIMGASLRLPAKNSWLCNVSMGGSSHQCDVVKEEYEMIEIIDPVLSHSGIVMYGVDTLVGDDGQRVLSEINTTSIGGLPQIASSNKQPLVQEAIDLIWKYFLENSQYAK